MSLTRAAAFLALVLVLIAAGSVPGEAGPLIIPKGGIPGLLGVPGYEVVTGHTALNDDTLKQRIVFCPIGKLPLGGGWAILSQTDAFLNDGHATNSLPYTHFPTEGGDQARYGWLVNAVRVPSETNWRLEVSVVCAPVP